MLLTYPPAQVILGAILSFFFAPWIKKSKTKGRILYYLFTVSVFPAALQMFLILCSDGTGEVMKDIFSAIIYLLIWSVMFLLLLFGQIHMREEWDDDEAWTKFEVGFACSLFIFVFSIIAAPGSIFLFELVYE